MKLNEAAKKHAKSLIEQGKVDFESSWEWDDKRDGDLLLGSSVDWENYKLWFLGRRPEVEDEHSKDAWAYPYGKGGKLYRSALTAIRQRAGQQNHAEIFEAAGELLELVDQRKKSGSSGAELSELVPLDGELPDEIEVLKVGTLQLDGKSLSLTRSHLESMVEYFNEKNIPLPIDYYHATLSAHERDGKAPAAGWITKLWCDGDVLKAKVDEWTPEAKRALLSHEYRFISAVPILNDIDPETGKKVLGKLHSVALTNTPVVKSLRALFSEKPSGEYIKFRKAVIESIGLGEQATDDEIIEAIRNMKAERVPAKVARALGLSEKIGVDDAIRAIVEIKGAKDKALVQRVAELEAELRQRDIDDVLCVALSAGKILPTEQDFYKRLLELDFSAAKKVIDELPVRVRLSERITKPAQKTKAELSEYERVVCQKLGLSEEAIRKYT